MSVITSKFFRGTIICILFYLSGISIAFSQPFANNWIDYNQKYYKIKIVNDGIYRINTTVLTAAGILYAAINPHLFQIWSRGQQQFIYVEGEADNTFNTTDFIEFYAEKNDGYFDSNLYPAGEHGNPYYSNFSDTAVYYLTWSISSTSNRMSIDNDQNYTAYSPAPFFWTNSVKVYGDEYFYGEIDYYGQSKAGYHAGEGWFSNSFSKPGSLSYSLPAANVYTAGPAAVFKTNVISASNDASSNTDNELNIQFGNQSSPLIDAVFDGYQLLTYNFSVSPSDISASNLIVYTSVNLSSTNPGRMAVGFMDLKYPHTINFDNKTDFKFALPFSGNSKNHIQILNFNNQSSTERLYNLTNHSRITIGLNGSVKSGILTEFGNEQVCYLTSDAKIINVSSLSPVNANSANPAFFKNYVNSGDPNSLVGKKFIIITSSSLLDVAQNYKGYRNNSGLPAEVVLVEELYDQFANGILKHPLAIKNFADYVYHQISSAEYFLYLGKSISSELTRHDLNNYNHNLVPSFGYPSADILLTSNIITPTSLEPAFATGRIAAKKDEEAQTYLTKLGEYEGLAVTSPNAQWRKQVLHFAGGSNQGQTDLLKYYLKNYEDTIEAQYFGGNVTTFSKSSTAPIQITTSDSIKIMVNAGVSIMTFFGHASGSGFDVDLNSPDNYSNTNGRYPLLIGNSCFAGDIHQPAGINLSSSEQWTLSERGTIGFLAQVGAGFPSSLFTYTQELYSNISRKNYSKSIGKCIKSTIANLQSQSVNDYILTATCQEMTLHGDPAVVIASPKDPDLMVSASNIVISPAVVTTDLDSFKITATIINLGKAVTQNVEVSLTHKDTTYRQTIIGGVNYSQPLDFYIRINPLEDGGLNNFVLTVDPINWITPEISENNNEVSFNINIISNDIFPIYPYEYAIIPGNKVTLKASTANPLAPARNYIFQIDTTDLFNSGKLEQGIINSVGGVVEWNTNNITLLDSTQAVYFWRVAPADTAGTGYKWHESSFQYIPQKTGWGQSHIFQLKKDKFTFLDYNRPNRRVDFSNNAKLLTVTTYGHAGTQNEWYGSEVRLDLEQMDYGGCGPDNIHIMVFDTLDLEPWGTYDGISNPTHQFGNNNDLPTHCRQRVENYFSFNQKIPSEMQACASMLDTVPIGFYIVAYTFPIGLHQTDTTLVLRNKLISLGATVINSVVDGNPYIFFTRKGFSYVNEKFGNLPTDKLQLYDTLRNDWYYGNITSTLAGPASQWNEFHWDRFALENPTTDSVKIEFYGVKNDGSETLLGTYSPATLDVLNLNTIINASIYPFARLKVLTQDQVNRTPDQLKYWRLYYTAAPEAAVAPNLYLSYTQGEMQEGQQFEFKMAIKNVSPINMDSMLVKYWVEDEDRIIHDITYEYHYPKPWKYQDSLRALDSMIIGIKYPSNGLNGTNTFWVEINPAGDQLEQYHFNNYATLNFNVDRDKYNPLLDVTFDGIHILDGDIVSAKPDISIQLKDENQFLLMNTERDTANFKVSLIRPNTTIPERIYFKKNGVEILKYTPAQNSENRFKIEYKPEFIVDGKYQLIIQAIDKSGNKSGAFDFKTKFEVITKSSITEVMNYPNPFSSSTHFVFTLTGSEVPEIFKIQIFNISGRVVKEIHASELGPIHIGRNITEYAWDGRDDFGDKLANGVYFYKVFTRIANKEIEKMETNADQFFKKGFGKMVIIH